MQRQKKHGPNERTDQSSRKKVQLSDREIANLSDAEFKTLVIRILTEIIEYGHKIKEMKAIRSEIKQKHTCNQQGREGNWDSNQ